MIDSAVSQIEMTATANVTERDDAFFWKAILFSLLLHVLTLPSLPWLISRPDKDEIAKDRPITYRLDRLPDGQVVDLDNAPPTERVPADTPYLSDVNRTADREMQARRTGPLTPPMSAQRPSQQQSKPQRQAEKLPKSDRGLRPYEVNTKLPQEWLANLQPAAPSNYLPNIAMGDRTLLNTREYAYAPFFNRMKRQMELVWSPNRFLNRKGLSMRDEYRTVVAIRLRSDGSYHSARVIQSSNIEELDREALRAVRLAGPYLNPPEGLIGQDGHITIPHWHFIVTQRPVLF